jgi:hypothetical protein
MGALDDAIREHLELKRQHGASEEEIRQAEAEALGPARREPGADPFVDEAPLPAPTPLYDDAYHEPIDEPPPPLPSDAVEDAPPPPPIEAPPPDSVPLDPTALRALPGDLAGPAPVEPAEVEPAPVEPAPVYEPPVDDVPAEDAPVEAHDPGAHEPPPEDDGPDRAATAILDDPLRDAPPPIHHEPGPDEPPAPARPPGAEPPEDDVLEETPEFLQDTPDHDRLWFEQKPPRDFDLDD